MRSSKKKNKNSRWRRYSILLVVIILIASYVLIILTVPLKRIYATNLTSPVSGSGKLSVMWPTGDQAAIGVQGYGLLASNGAQTPTPTASIAKLVTALTVLKKYPLAIGDQGPTITLNNSDVADYTNYLAEDGSVVKVVAGEQITEYQAMQAMLLPSANNMADSLANWAYGSMGNYVLYANEMVKSLGMNSTSISDASGFSPNTLSTTSDLIKLGEAALNSPVITQIVGQPSAVIPVAGTVKNVDYILGQNNIIGIKTGNTDQAGGCFLSAAKYYLGGNNSITVLGAIMKAPTLQVALNQTVPMLQSVKNQLQLKSIPSNTPISSYKQPWGSTVTAVTSGALTSTYLPGMTINYTNHSNSIVPPIRSGSLVGSASFSIGNYTSSTNIILSKGVSKPSIVWKIFHPQYII